MNGPFIFSLSRRIVRSKFFALSCKILRDATPKSLVILDGRLLSIYYVLLKFIAKTQNLEGEHRHL
jgi:hypothetical protein